jgi:hypothetical protein
MIDPAPGTTGQAAAAAEPASLISQFDARPNPLLSPEVPQLLEVIEAGGWVMLPIIACSIVATAIVLERSWALRRRRIMPDNLVSSIWQLHRTNKLTEQRIQEIRDGSPLGRILAAGVVNRFHSREIRWWLGWSATSIP